MGGGGGGGGKRVQEMGNGKTVWEARKVEGMWLMEDIDEFSLRLTCAED